MASELTVTALAINHWELVSKLFATSSGVDGCWCTWPRRSRGTHNPDRKVNRAAMKEILDSGRSPGLIALVGERAVGWCAIGPRETYPQYEPAIDQRSAWAIPCLYIDPMPDRNSIARALIEAAVNLAAKNAAAVVEGPPPYWFPGNSAAIAEATNTFLENGFERVGPGARMPELRRGVRTDD